MNNTLETLSFASTYKVDKSFDSDKFIKMKLKVMHNGDNVNLTSFEDKVISNAKNSIYNIPILGNVVIDKDGNFQFSGHDRKIVKDKDGKSKILYVEQPIGLIPESSLYEYKEEDGKKYVFVDAYIWKDYANYAQDIIERDKSIKLSMEIIIDKFSYDRKTDNYNVKEYRYQGITFLGNDKTPAMKGANAQTYELETFDKMREDLKTELFEKGGNDNLKNKDIVNEVPETNKIENDGVLDANESYDDKNKDNDDNIIEGNFVIDTNSNYSTYKELSVKLSKALNNLRKIVDTDTVYSSEYYYLVDFDDTYVYTRKYTYIYSITDKKTLEDGCKYIRASYVEEDDSIVIKDDYVEMVMKLITIEENESIENAREKEKLDFEELVKFKNDTIASINEDKIQSLFEQFDNRLSSNEDYCEMKLHHENMKYEEVEGKCYQLLGKMAFSTNQKIEEQKENIKVPFEMVIEPKKDSTNKIKLLEEAYED